MNAELATKAYDYIADDTASAPGLLSALDIRTTTADDLIRYRDSLHAAMRRLPHGYRGGPRYGAVLDSWGEADAEIDRRGCTRKAERQARIDALADDGPTYDAYGRRTDAHTDAHGHRFYTDEFGRRWHATPGGRRVQLW